MGFVVVASAGAASFIALLLLLLLLLMLLLLLLLMLLLLLLPPPLLLLLLLLLPLLLLALTPHLPQDITLFAATGVLLGSFHVDVRGLRILGFGFLAVLGVRGFRDLGV